MRADRVARERGAVEASSRFATSIDLRARGAVVEGLGELLDEAPGVHVRSSGDALSPATVSVRGAPASHVTVALDGVVLNDSSSDGVDLSLIPPVLLERADVYRGAAPVRLGVEGIGGTVELFTRAPGPRPTAWVQLGGGAFLQRRASVAVSAQSPHALVRTLLAVSYRGTQGDFPFYDDHGTPLVSSDDNPAATRVNNAGNALDVLFRACVRSACVLATTTAREHGLPGPGSGQYASPRVISSRALARASLRIALPSARGWVEPYLLALGRSDRFTDASGLLTGTRIDALGTGASGELGALATLGDARGEVRLEPIARVRVERFDTASATGGVLTASRVRALAGADLRLVRGPIEVASGLAVDVLDDSSTSRPSIAQALLSPRLGLRVRLASWLELRANASHLTRAPTLPELYGIAGYLTGNPALVPERSDSVDAGLVATLRSHTVEARLEAAGYARRANDLLVQVRSSAVAFTPINLRAADIAGVEAGARVAFGRAAALVASYAYTYAATRAAGAASDGLRPPSIPAHDLYVRAEGTLGPFHAWADVSFVAGVFYDELDRLPSPARTLLGGAVSFTPPFAAWFTLTALGTNLLDQRDGIVTLAQGATTYSLRQPIADFAGYPLPGRSFFVSLSFRTDPRSTSP